MAGKYLGPSFDIHGGGLDLIFPHHFMSGAQAQALLGRPFARHYVHAGMVGLDGEKMSKSKGNLVFVSKLISAGVDPMIIRFALLQDHYQSDRMWSDESLKNATEAVAVIRSALSREFVSPTEGLISEIITSLSQNLDTPAVLAKLRTWAERVDDAPTQQGAGELSRTLDALLGLAL
jgi:L-cysteine:1D-myo-inositol 2-amino-2-deoxy-alpha-D-glucopyranoside ligase